MFHYYQPVQNRAGEILPGYFLQVVDPATNLAVPIYSDRSGTPIITVSGVANMAKVDANGMASFYILDGNYNVNVYAQDATTSKGAYLDVPMVGGVSLTIGTVTTLAPGAAPTASIDSTSAPAKLNLGLPVTTGTAGPTGPQGPAGNASGVTQVASLAALGAVTGQSAGDTRYLTAPGLEGTFVYKLGDYSAKVTADTQKGLFVAASGIATTVGAWVRVYTGAANLTWFGTVGDDSTDDRPAFVGALSALKALSNQTTGDFRATPELYVPIPPKAYYLSAGLNIHQSIHIRGAGSGQPDSQGTILRFAANNDCIVINDYRTDANTGTTLTNNLGGSGGTIIEGLTIWGGGAISVTGPYSNVANTTGRGIFVRAILVKLIDVFVAFNAQSGVDIHASAGSTGATQGNANEFYCERVWSTYNGSDGYVVSGTDANAGTFVQCSAVSNAGCGFKDYSFLGNTYVQCHARDNGIVDPNFGNNPVGTCKYSGVYYYVVAGQEAAASTTTPGTNSAVWRTWVGNPNCKTWTSGLTWALGAPYATNTANSNARNVFMGCYAESAQAPVQAFAPTLILGGLLEEVTVDGTAAWLRGGTGGGVNIGSASGLNGGGYAVAGSQASMVFGGSGGGTNDGSGNEAFYHQIGSNNYRIKRVGTTVQRFEDNANITEQWGLATDASAQGPYHHYINRLFIGHPVWGGTVGNSIGMFTIANAAELNGLVVPSGARYFYQFPAANQREGIVVLTGGTVGTTAVTAEFGKIGPNVGYITGDGGAVTQATSKSTAVTLNNLCGQITLNGAALAANTAVSFVLTNSKIAATDCMRVNIASGAATPSSYLVQAEAFASGSVTISIRNLTAGSLSEALVLNFATIKSVNS